VQFLEDELIIRITISGGYWFEMMKFETNKGRLLGPYGRLQGLDVMVEGPVHGFYGSTSCTYDGPRCGLLSGFGVLTSSAANATDPAQLPAKAAGLIPPVPRQ
jgi:hypothetical protein